jgi:CheY-like chemotaxis protein
MAAPGLSPLSHEPKGPWRSPMSIPEPPSEPNEEDVSPEDEDPVFLTIDDEPNINWSLERLVLKCGYRVHPALCGQEALALARRHRYWGIFVDAKLPDIEGPQLAEQLRRLQAEPFIVLISGYFFQDDPTVEHALQVGTIQAFVAKPFLHTEILGLVERIARRGGPRRSRP